MENKTKYEKEIWPFGRYWACMRAEEGPLAKRCARFLTTFI